MADFSTLKTNFLALPEDDRYTLVRRLRVERQVFIEDILTAKSRARQEKAEKEKVGVVKSPRAKVVNRQTQTDKIKETLSKMSPTEQMEFLKNLGLIK